MQRHRAWENTAPLENYEFEMAKTYMGQSDQKQCNQMTNIEFN